MRAVEVGAGSRACDVARSQRALVGALRSMATGAVLSTLLTLWCVGCASRDASIVASSGAPGSLERADDERNALSTGSPASPPSEVVASSVLARPMVIGASVSAGAASRDLEGRTVDLAIALDGWITSPHASARTFASSVAFLDPVVETTRQVEAVTEAKPSVVFALDVCFWPVNARATDESERLARLEAVLTSLALIDVPLVLGDIPDRDEARTTILGGLAMSSPATRAEANRRVRAWAAERPQVVVVSLEEFVRRAASGEEIDLVGEKISGDAARAFIAPDRLHASARGVTALAGIALDELVSRGFATRTSLAPSLEVAIERCTPIPEDLPADAEKDVAQQQVVVIEKLVATRKLMTARDPTAIERGIELVDMVPSRLSSPCETQLVRDLAATSPDARRTLEGYLSTCALRALSADARPADYARWVFVAAGLGDVSAMRTAAQTYSEALTRTPPRTNGEERLADSTYDALDGADEIAAGVFWPDPAATMKRWQHDADELAAGMRAAGVTSPVSSESSKAKAASRRAPPARGARLATYLRAAGRDEDAARVDAIRPPS